jgi:hypothetical protein
LQVFIAGAERRAVTRTEQRDTEHCSRIADEWIAWARTALEQAGLAIASLREPAAKPGSGPESMERWTRWPMFLWLKARPLAR